MGPAPLSQSVPTIIHLFNTIHEDTVRSIELSMQVKARIFFTIGFELVMVKLLLIKTFDFLFYSYKK
jgi:hypothetical protein